MKHKNYYEILEISQDASYSEIKRAYYRLCKLYHPDINPKTANIFKNINEAYDVLINPVTRREYDESLVSKQYEETDNNFYSQSNRHDSYYNQSQYYQDPSKEPIIDILNDLDKYRFENATKSIFNRNIFVIFGNTIVSFIIFMATFSNRIAKLFKKSLISKKTHKSYWINLLFNSMKENTLGKFFTWFSILTAVSFCKVIYLILKALFFIYTKILKPLFIPISIILAALIWSGRSNNYRRY